MKYNSAQLLLVVDLIGTFVFGLEGASAAIQYNLDLPGILVLAFSTALAGGLIRARGTRVSFVFAARCATVTQCAP